MTPTSRRNMLFTLLAVTVLAPLLVLAIYVDDWSRDLTTNVAWTDPKARDEHFRPFASRQSTAGTLDAIQAFVENHSQWSLAPEAHRLPSDSPLSKLEGVHSERHLVRVSPIMHWTDDVWVVLTGNDVNCLVHAHSQSRVGKGDLGQNPRNLRELLTALREIE